MTAKAPRRRRVLVTASTALGTTTTIAAARQALADLGASGLAAGQCPQQTRAAAVVLPFDEATT